MKFDTRCIPEPELEFGDGGLFIDPRIGLMRHGPLQDHTSQVVRVGVIGTSETVEGLAGYLERAMVGIDGAEGRGGNLAPAFPAWATATRSGVASRWPTEGARRS